MKNIFKTVLLVSALSLSTGAANAFDVKVGPLNVRLCNSGEPGSAKSPAFKLGHVPAGTKYIRIRLVDLDASGFNHGGAVLPYTGKSTIKAGAFSYLQPCPPSGRHRYVWQLTAKSKESGGNLGKAKFGFKYP
jgi:phosphatidylethanolamine-binding protein (PEBP) family uncharacterized protein